MRNAEIEVRMPGPDLPVVLRELVDRICADDWHRLSTQDGAKFYYVVGEEAAQLHRDGPLHFAISEFPGAGPSDGPKQAGPIAEYILHSQVAAKHPNYLQRARRRLEQAGVTAN